MTLVVRGFNETTIGVHAIRVSPHFAVHCTMYSDHQTVADCWTATHILSGMWAVSEVPLADAVAAAMEFEVVCDWDFIDPKEGAVLNGQRWLKAGEVRAKFERTGR